MIRWAIVVGLCSCSILAATAAQQPVSGSSVSREPNPGNGKTLFVKNGCSQCHGLEGQGAPTSGPRIGPNPLPLVAFVRYVRSPAGQMPPYSSRVATDADLGEMRAYLASRPGPVAQTLLPAE